MKVLGKTESIDRELKPAFGERGIPVAFFADCNYFPYVAVAVRSIVETASPENAYDVLVFTDADVRTSIRERLLDVTRGCSNVSLRLVVLEKTDLAPISGLFVGGLSAMTYGRLLLPSLLANYRRAIYLDVDIVVREDLAHLFGVDLKGNLLGAVKDEGVIRFPFPPQWREDILRECPDFDFGPYVNAGVLLMNLEGIRREKSMVRALELAVRNRFILCDQDALNIAFVHRLFLLPVQWNQCTKALPIEPSTGSPDVLGVHRGIVHFTEVKPWRDLRRNTLAWMWWDVASRTSYYRDFLLMAERTNRLVRAKVCDLLKLWIVTRADNRLARHKCPSFLFAAHLSKWRNKLVEKGLLAE